LQNSKAFQDDFIVKGGTVQGRVANLKFAVPPLLAKIWLALAIKKYL